MEMLLDEFKGHMACSKCKTTDKRLIPFVSYGEDNRHFCPECFDSLQKYLTALE